MTKKELDRIVDGLVAAVTLKLTEGQGDAYEPTAAEEDGSRTLVGITIKKNRAALLAAVPVFGDISAPVAVPVAADVS